MLMLAVDKRYTFILKDKLLPKNPENGREQSTISWEYDFSISSQGRASNHDLLLFIPWDSLKPTYRGKEKKDAPSLDRKNIKRFSIMMRSFFGDQEGPFSLSIRSIKAIRAPHDVEKGADSVEDRDGAPPTRNFPLFRILITAVLSYWVISIVIPSLYEYSR